MGRLADLLGQLDASPVARGHQFELLCKWLLENDPLYEAQLDKVWLWDEWPGRWGPDTGIDLVAKTKTGELWAVVKQNAWLTGVSPLVGSAPSRTFTRELTLFQSEDDGGSFAHCRIPYLGGNNCVDWLACVVKSLSFRPLPAEVA
jgi:hypothetical protein